MTKLSLPQLAAAQKLADTLIGDVDSNRGGKIEAKRQTMDDLVGRPPQS
jgi:hypothetical protein